MGSSAPMVFVVNVYLLFFGLVTCISEVNSDVLPVVHVAIEHYQNWMHEWALGLTELWGRGLFYLFQGTLALVSSQSILSLGIIVGPYMIIMGIYFLYLYKQRHGKADDKPLPPQFDYIR